MSRLSAGASFAHFPRTDHQKVLSWLPTDPERVGLFRIAETQRKKRSVVGTNRGNPATIGASKVLDEQPGRSAKSIDTPMLDSYNRACKVA